MISIIDADQRQAGTETVPSAIDATEGIGSSSPGVNGPERTGLRSPVAFPSCYTRAQSAVIDAAIAEASADRKLITLERTGTVLHPADAHYARFRRGPALYALTCERRVEDGLGWETIPVCWPGAVARWRSREAGRILHLIRFFGVHGEWIYDASWEPAWLAAPWGTRADFIKDGSLQRAQTCQESTLGIPDQLDSSQEVEGVPVKP